jgi:hypothetical protein
MSRPEVVVPFRSPADEAAFYRMQAFLPPEDQDEWVHMQNRRHSDGALHPDDTVMMDRFIGIIIDGMRIQAGMPPLYEAE